jgi:hypothetical protein
MPMTRAEADENLAQAIRLVAEAYEIAVLDAEMLGDFAVIASWIPVRADEYDADGEDGETRYTTHYHRSPIPIHIAQGLFSIAMDLAGPD